MATTERKPRISLELLVDDTYLEGYHELMTNHAAARWSTSRMPTSIEETWMTLQARMPSEEKPWCRSWGIVLLDEGKVEEANAKDGKKGRFIGAIGHPLEAVIGYRLLPEYWGQGYMTEALRCFLGLWFDLEETQKHDKVQAGVDPENLASQRVLEKVGFVRGEYVKDACQKTVEGGKWSDIQVFDFYRGSVVK